MLMYYFFLCGTHNEAKRSFNSDVYSVKWQVIFMIPLFVVSFPMVSVTHAQSSSKNIKWKMPEINSNKQFVSCKLHAVLSSMTKSRESCSVPRWTRIVPPAQRLHVAYTVSGAYAPRSSVT